MAAINKTRESGKAVAVKAGTLKNGAAKRPPAGKKPVKSKAAKGSKSPAGNRKPADVGAEDGLKPGTVIGVDRGLYKHYGIYAGHGSIIHYASRSGDFGDEMSVRKTGVEHFLNGAANFFVCEFPDAHGRPSESRRDASIFGALASALRGDGPLAEPDNPLALLVDIFELFKKFNYKLYSAAETLRRAKDRLGESSYSLFFNNCEHFVVWCKTGVSESHQVNEIINAVSGRR